MARGLDSTRLGDGGGASSSYGIRAGDILAGKYRVERVLGLGGMGVVLAAHHLELDSKVAIKLLLPEMLDDKDAVSRFSREARAAVKITSEHVARVFDVGKLATGEPFIVMEFLEGGDLAGWLEQRGPLPIEQAVEFMLQACVGVAEAHALGIVHRDLKPANLFCVRRSDGQLSIKVLDFGISKISMPGAWTEPSLVLTRTLKVMGSPLYMSPEQMQSAKSAEARSDIWALGVILYELLTGKVPFDGTVATEVAVKVANIHPESPRAFRPDVPEGLERVIFRCLEKDPVRRYRNVAELAHALLRFAPRRARAYVERISGIIQAAGLSVSALDLPPSPRSATQPAGTLPPVGRTTAGRPGRTRVLAWGGGAALALTAGLVILWPSMVNHTGRAAGVALPSPPDPSPSASATPSEAPAPVPPTAAPVIDAAVSTSRATPPTTASAAPVMPPPKKRGAPRPASPAPCKLTTTLDENGHPHFSCPCATCK